MVSIALHQIDAVLRGSTASTARAPTRALSRLLLLVLTFGLFYGAIMGCYGGLAEDRLRQPLYSALKVPLLLLVTFSLSIPSFYILNLLFVLGGAFPEVLRALVTSIATLTLVLASLS